VHERDKPRVMEVTDPNRDLFSWTRDGARIGRIDFETWFATHPQGDRR
jgi:hypothetical protein